MAVGASSIALASSDLAMVGGAEALFYNPAGMVATQNKTELMFSNSQLIADMKLNFVAVTQSLGDFGTLGRERQGAEHRRHRPDHGVVAGWNGSNVLTDLQHHRPQLRQGHDGSGEFRRHRSTTSSENILQETAAGVAFDFGFQYDTGGAQLAVRHRAQEHRTEHDLLRHGFRIHHADSGLGSAGHGPKRRHAVGGVRVAHFAAGFGGRSGRPGRESRSICPWRYNSNSFGRDEGRFGAEWTLKKMLSLRGGYIYNGDSNASYQYSYGLGLKVPVGGSHMTVDWAAQPVHGGYFDDVQNLSVGLTF